MARTSAEVKQVIADVKGYGFDGLIAYHKEKVAQLHCHQSYADSLVATLDPSITTVIPLPSKRPQHARRQTVGILRASYSWHVEPRGDKTDTARRFADRRELYFAGLWSETFKHVMEPTLGDQAVGQYALWWLEWEPFKLPANEADREAYRKSYQPFRLMRIDPMTAYFLPDDAGMPTTAVREFEIPYVEFAKRYGKGKDKDPLTILGEEFPNLRGARGQPLDTATMTKSKAKVCIIDDGQTICHYVEIKDGEYEAATEEVPNPWGRPSLFVVHGQYNPEGEKLEDVYKGLLDEMMAEQKNYDTMRSHMASLAFTANKFGQVLPPEAVAQHLADEGSVPMASFKDGIANLLGQPHEFSQQPGQAAWELLQTQQAERDATLPPPYLTSPDESVLKQATAAAQLNANETSNKMYDGARDSLITQMVAVCDAIKHFMCGGWDEVKAESGRESLYYKPTGKESTATVYAGDYKDQEVELSREVFEMDATLEITIVASSQSQKALEYELVKQRVADGTATHRDLIAVNTENVEGKVKELMEEDLFQMYVPAVSNAVLLNSLMTIQADSGINLLPIFMQAGVIDPSMVGGGVQPTDGVGGARTDPPATTVPAVAART